MWISSLNEILKKEVVYPLFVIPNFDLKLLQLQSCLNTNVVAPFSEDASASRHQLNPIMAPRISLSQTESLRSNSRMILPCDNI